MGLTVSCDLNYRAKLWKWGKPASEVMPGLVAYTDLVLMVPVANAESVGLRDVINDEEVEEVFAVLRKKEARMPTNWSARISGNTKAS